MVESSVMATSYPLCHGVTEGVKTKLARIRGENLIHAVPPDLCQKTLKVFYDISLEPITGLAVPLTCGDGACSVFSDFRSRVVFGGHSWKRFSTCDLFSLSGLDHVLVPVDAFDGNYYMPPVWIVKRKNAWKMHCGFSNRIVICCIP